MCFYTLLSHYNLPKLSLSHERAFVHFWILSMKIRYEIDHFVIGIKGLLRKGPAHCTKHLA